MLSPTKMKTANNFMEPTLKTRPMEHVPATGPVIAGALQIFQQDDDSDSGSSLENHGTVEGEPMCITQDTDVDKSEKLAHACEASPEKVPVEDVAGKGTDIQEMLPSRESESKSEVAADDDYIFTSHLVCDSSSASGSRQTTPNLEHDLSVNNEVHSSSSKKRRLSNGIASKPKRETKRKQAPKVENLEDVDVPASLEIDDADTVISSGRVTSSMTDSKPQTPDQYQLGTYPMKRLAQEAFLVESTPKAICFICMDNKLESDPESDIKPIKCHGPCMRDFHAGCLKIDRKKVAEDTWRCPECTSGMRKCFTCGVEGLDLVKCPELSCGMFYHTACLMGTPANAEQAPAKLKSCRLHHCHSCELQGRLPKGKINRKMVKCTLCPMAFHFDFMCFPAESTVNPDNASNMKCWRHTETEPVHRSSKKGSGKKNRDHRTYELRTRICFFCLDGGELLLCETCPFTAHKDCAGLDEVPTGAWSCNDCAKGTKPMILDIVWYKFGSHRTWPCQIIPEQICPAAVLARHPGGASFPMRFLGTKEYAFATSKEILPFDTCDPQWKRNPSSPKNFAEGLVEAISLSAELLKIKEYHISHNFEGVRPVYHKIKVNKAIAPAKYGMAVKSDDHHVCECKKTDPDPCGASSNCLNREMEYECNPKHCPAGDLCQNQRLRNRKYPTLKVFYTANRGWALKTMNALKKGDLAIEYVGEIITAEERNRRIREKMASGDVNFYYLDLTNGRVIDAGPSGNVARFANHSCDANCSSQKWIVDGETRIALIATRDLKKGEEITFDYRWEYEFGVTSRECLCGAKSCRGKIGGKTYTAADTGKGKRSSS